MRATNYLDNAGKSVDADFRNSGGDVPGRAEGMVERWQLVKADVIRVIAYFSDSQVAACLF